MSVAPASSRATVVPPPSPSHLCWIQVQKLPVQVQRSSHRNSSGAMVWVRDGCRRKSLARGLRRRRRGLSAYEALDRLRVHPDGWRDQNNVRGQLKTAQTARKPHRPSEHNPKRTRTLKVECMCRYCCYVVHFVQIIKTAQTARKLYKPSEHNPKRTRTLKVVLL